MVRGTKILFGLVLGFLLVGSFTGVVRALSVVGSTNVVGPGGVAYSSSNGDLYVVSVPSAPQPAAVLVVSGQSHAIVDSVSVGQVPMSPLYDQGKNEIYLFADTQSLGYSVVGISAVTNTVTATIGPLREPPEAMAYDSGKGELFAFLLNGTVEVISDTSNSIVSRINISSYGGNAVEGAVYDPAKGEVFYTPYNDQDQVRIISDQSNTVVGSVSVGARPWGATYDPAKGEVVVGDGGNLTAISDTNNSVVMTANIGRGILTSLAYDPVRNEIWAADNGGGGVEAVSDSNYSLVKTLSTGPSPYYLAYDNGNGEVFVADTVNNTLSAVADASLSITPSTGPSGTSVALNGSFYSPGHAYSYCYEPGSLTSPLRCSSAMQFTATSTGAIPSSTTLTATGTSGLVVVSDPSDPTFLVFQAFSMSGLSTISTSSTLATQTTSTSAESSAAHSSGTSTLQSSSTGTSSTSGSSSASSVPFAEIALVLGGGVVAVVVLWKLFVAKGAAGGSVKK